MNMANSYLFRFLVSLGLLMTLGCGHTDETADVAKTQQTISLTPVRLQADEVPQQLGGSVSLPSKIPASGERRIEDLKLALSAVTESGFDVTETTDRYLIESHEFSGFITKDRTTFSIVRREEEIRAGETPSPSSGRGLKHPDEAAMVQTARQLTEYLGASSEELSSAVHRRLAAAASDGSDHLLGHKIFIFRTIAGLDVPQDRSVVSFDTEGRFRAMRGSWTAYQNAGESLKVSLASNSEEFEELAQRAAVSAFPDAEADSAEIRFKTYFEIDNLTRVVPRPRLDFRGMRADRSVRCLRG